MPQVETTFRDGAAYERLMGRWSRLVGTPFLDWMDLPPGLDWLDAGCGNGAFSEQIVTQARSRSLTGLDPAPAQLAYARQRPGLGTARFHQGDAQSLPFPDASFDVSAMALVIAFIPDPARALAELARVTRPGGWIATYMWDLPGGLPLAPLFRALAALGRPGAMPPSAAVSTAPALASLWADAGLRGIETTTIRIPVTFRDFQDFWETNILPVGPQAEAIQALSPDERNRLRQTLQASLPTAADGSITYHAVANAVKGRRQA